jgi:hypothetical protein
LKLKIPPELENFDPEAFQRSQAQPGTDDLQQYDLKSFNSVIASRPNPAPESANPVVLETPAANQLYVNPWNSAPAQVRETANPVVLETAAANQAYVNPWNSAPAQVNEQSFSQALSAIPDEAHLLVLNPSDVQLSPHFEQPLSYNPFSPPQESWKIPRWLIASMAIFFGSAAVLMVVLCVVLLRDPKPAPPTVQLVVPTAPVATAPVTPPPPTKAPAAPVIHKTPIQEVPSALPHRVAVSRHPAFVRRPTYGSRRIAHESEGSSVASEETEKPRSRPPQDDLDKLLTQSSL